MINGQVYRKGSVSCFQQGNYVIGYTINPPFSDLHIGTLSVWPASSLQRRTETASKNEPRTETLHDRLIVELDKFQSMVYRLTPKLFQDLFGSAPQLALEVLSRHYAVDFCHDTDTSGRQHIPRNNFFLVYVIGGKTKTGEVYRIPMSLVMASGFYPDKVSHDIIAYLRGRPAVAASQPVRESAVILESGKTDALIKNLTASLGGLLNSVRIKVNRQTDSGIVIPADGIGLNRLEEIAKSD